MWRTSGDILIGPDWCGQFLCRWCTRGLLVVVQLACLNLSHALAQEARQEQGATGPEVWGELWEPAWEGGWFTQAPPWTLDVTVGRRTFRSMTLSRDAERSEIYALARINVPWESLLLAREIEGGAELSSASPANQEVPPPPGVEEPAGPIYGSGSPASPREGTRSQDNKLSDDRSPPPQEEGATPQQELSSALLRLVRETTSHLAAVEATRVFEARLESLVRRSRHSGMVPELRLRGVYAFDQTTSLEDAAGIYPGETTTRGGRDSLLEARMTFRLDRLVFGDQESSLERQRVAVKEAEAKRVEVALDELLAWRLAERRSMSPALHPEEQLKAQGQAELALARLHIQTAGWFRGRGTTRALGIDELLFPSSESELADREALDTVSHGYPHGSVQVRQSRDRRAGEGEAAFDEGQGGFPD